MATVLPTPDTSHLLPIRPDEFVAACIATRKRPSSPGELHRALKKYLDRNRLGAILQDLQQQGRIEQTGDKFSYKGTSPVGKDKGKPWPQLQKRFALQALGLDPDASKVRQKRGSWFQLAVISASYDLAADNRLNAPAIRSELVWRIMRPLAGQLIGTGPFPVIDKPGTVERLLLARLAGTSGLNMNTAINALAARAIGAQSGKTNDLVARLVAIGLDHDTAHNKQQTGSIQPSPQPSSSSSDSPDTTTSADFIARVKTVAARLSTPPFAGRVAIAQLYDEFGKTNPDAGSLDSFKQRLLAAARQREIELGRLDMPERMSKDLRQRSETLMGSDEVHFVVTEWK